MQLVLSVSGEVLYTTFTLSAPQLQACARQERFLALNTQWPFTLAAFRELHPHAHGHDRPVQSYSMWLCPVSTGSRMVVDSGPHLLNML